MMSSMVIARRRNRTRAKHREHTGRWTLIEIPATLTGETITICINKPERQKLRANASLSYIVYCSVDKCRVAYHRL